ncbi:hypothetical protein NLI96_g943 [Meripilus lineatus]|uniref:Uncharacterized protein n=1 Tax=Meripilus lineatus TaxID=2056292 RepID=A0AAD5VBD1_9APHY|nr:hypothetical protein NLI96_g943 [Physisporinus lineatus]
MIELLRQNHNTLNIGMASNLELNRMMAELYKKKFVEREERVYSLSGPLTTSQAEFASLSTRIGVPEA